MVRRKTIQGIATVTTSRPLPLVVNALEILIENLQAATIAPAIMSYSTDTDLVSAHPAGPLLPLQEQNITHPQQTLAWMIPDHVPYLGNQQSLMSAAWTQMRPSDSFGGILPDQSNLLIDDFPPPRLVLNDKNQAQLAMRDLEKARIDIEARKYQVARQENDVAVRSSNVANREHFSALRRLNVMGREQGLAAENRRAAERDRILTQRENTLREQQSKAITRGVGLSKREEKTHNRERQLNMQEKELNMREKRLDKREKRLNKQEELQEWVSEQQEGLIMEAEALGMSSATAALKQKIELQAKML